MSSEVFKAMKRMNLEEIEMQLALQCAPLFSGLKVSNLLVIQNDSMERLKRILKNTNISYYVLLQKEMKITMLLYNEKQLIKYLENERVCKLLNKMGYKNQKLYDMLSELRERYTKYMCNRQEFPHEMGIFLGYPIEDVEGYIINEGKNFLYTGCWKVYENLPEKEVLFYKFESVKETMIELILCGVKFERIIEVYGSEKLQKIAV